MHFVAVVIGDMGSIIRRSVAGGFLVGIIVTFLQAYLPGQTRFFNAFAFAIVILVL